MRLDKMANSPVRRCRGSIPDSRQMSATGVYVKLTARYMRTLMLVRYRSTGRAKFLNARLKGALSFARAVKPVLRVWRRATHFTVIDQTSASLLMRLK